MRVISSAEPIKFARQGSPMYGSASPTVVPYLTSWSLSTCSVLYASHMLALIYCGNGARGLDLCRTSSVAKYPALGAHLSCWRSRRVLTDGYRYGAASGRLLGGATRPLAEPRPCHALCQSPHCLSTRTGLPSGPKQSPSTCLAAPARRGNSICLFYSRWHMQALPLSVRTLRIFA